MFRLLLVLAVMIAVGTLGAGELLAQEAAADTGSVASSWRGSGFYLSWVKILASWLVFLAWVGTTDWLSTDCQAVGMGYQRWSPIVFWTFLLAFVLFWLLPIFWVGFPLLLIAYLAPLVTYIVLRNASVPNNQRVLTAAHLRYWFAQRLAVLGIKIEAEKRAPHELGPPVTLTARGGASERDDQVHLLTARQAPGFLDARQLIFEGLSRRANAIMLDYTQQSMAVRVMIDGVWHNDAPQSRETGDPLLEALKALCGMNPQERQKPQKGTFSAEYESKIFAGTLASQGTKTGERALIRFEDQKTPFQTLDDLGMRPQVQKALGELMNLKRGFLLFSAMPAAGLRTGLNVVLHVVDRFTREFAAVEEENNRYEKLENVTVVTYNAAEGQTPDSVLTSLFRQQPDVIVVRDLVNAQTVSMLCQEIREDERLVIGTVRAKDCAEALLRLLAMGAPPADIIPVIGGVVSQRLVRKLCNECKEAYAPTPQVLQQLGIPPGRVQAFYRPPQQPERVCPECGGIGYKGRTGLFELLPVNDAVREVLTSNPKLDSLRQAARGAGMRTFQEEGILLVAKGVTSLPELMRVLKQ